MQAQSIKDKWFMRTKDALIIASALGTFFVWGIKYYSLPAEVVAQAQDIQTVKAELRELHDYTLRTDGRLARIEDNQSYTNKGIDEIKGWLKSVANRYH